jgi:hypothetical protein
MVTRVLATVAVALMTAATAHAQHWQRITSDLHMTKTASAEGTSLTVVHNSGDVVTIEIDYATRAIRVTRNFETRSVDSPQSMTEVAQMLASSAAAKEVQRLARAKEAEADETSDGETIRLAGTVVGFLTGDRTALRRHTDHVRKHHGAGGAPPAPFGVGFRSGGRLRRISTPDECWAQYSISAVNIANAFVDCRQRLAWWEFTAAWSCDIEYVVRAEAAWAWFWACNGSSAPRPKAARSSYAVACTA